MQSNGSSDRYGLRTILVLDIKRLGSNLADNISTTFQVFSLVMDMAEDGTSSII